MSKNKGRTSVQVDIDEMDAVAPDFDIVDAESPIAERAVFKSDLGFWWECLAGLVLLQAFLVVFLAGSKILEHSDIAFALLIIFISIVFAILTGRFAGEESAGRKGFGFIMIGFGLVFGIAAFAVGALPNSSPLTYAAIGLTVAGWSLRRLLGESVLRCLSLGLVAAAPVLFLESTTFAGVIVEKVRLLIDSTAYWFAGVIADLNHVPFSPVDKGIKFSAGELHSIAAFDNIAGVLVAIALSIACSVLGRQSFISALLSAAAAYMWWVAIRSGYCVSMAMGKSFDGPLSEQAMPIYALLGLFLLIIATNLCFSSLMKAIAIDPGQFEVSPLTQIYNACVSFPQLGPKPPIVVQEVSIEAPPNKEELLHDEYKRAKEATLSAIGDTRSTPFREVNPNE